MLWLALLLVMAGVAWGAETDRFAWVSHSDSGPSGITLAVDVSDLPSGGLLYEREWIDGNVRYLVYPKWIPGSHAPSGPVASIGGIHIADISGNAIPWERDVTDPWRLHLLIDPPVQQVRVDLTYIANQPTDN